jgi:predicted glycoside hydrolase/deacetylase ChbG (UPF0249 family)
MLKIIVNADDCGMSPYVDNEIRKCIEDDIISSTTVMANMDDFDGAVKLYQDYRNKISFGIHFNLTEGHPLLKSQCLLDTGFYIEKDGKVSFFGKDFNYKVLTKDMKNAIEIELNAQAEKILDAGLKPSHIDSHHHVHWHREIIPIFSGLAAKYGNNKMRKEYFTSDGYGLVDSLKLHLWQFYARVKNVHLKTVDDLVYVDFLYKLIDERRYQLKKSYEIMVHPGHEKIEYQNEIQQLMDRKLIFLLNDNKLMTYNDLQK